MDNQPRSKRHHLRSHLRSVLLTSARGNSELTVAWPCFVPRLQTKMRGGSCPRQSPQDPVLFTMVRCMPVWGQGLTSQVLTRGSNLYQVE